MHPGLFILFYFSFLFLFLRSGLIPLIPKTQLNAFCKGHDLHFQYLLIRKIRILCKNESLKATVLCVQSIKIWF